MARAVTKIRDRNAPYNIFRCILKQLEARFEPTKPNNLVKSESTFIINMKHIETKK